MAKFARVSPLLQKLDMGYTLTSDDMEYEYAPIQDVIDDVKADLAEWEAIAA